MARPLIQRAKEEFQESVADKLKDCREVKASVGSVLEASKMSKKEKEFVSRELDRLFMAIEANLPFVADQLAETMDDIVSASKAEITAHMEELVKKTGISLPAGAQEIPALKTIG
jgi:threonine synthase